MDEALWYTADWDLWLRLGALGRTRHIGRPMAAFRVHAGSQTAARPRDEGELRDQMTRVLERHLSTWEGDARRDLERVARFSITANAALARGIAQGVPWTLLTGALRLGPVGLGSYLRHSRIAERLVARVRAGWARRVVSDWLARDEHELVVREDAPRPARKGEGSRPAVFESES